MDEREADCPKCGSKNTRRLISADISVIGTRDNFGFKNFFKDEETGKEIDNWKKWEKAGYRNPVDVTRNNTVKEKIKEKIEKKTKTTVTA